MFDSGTKVVLLESSHQKTVGPRKGSIGYISNCSDAITLPFLGERNAPPALLASVCEVFFIRYGFEKHGRLERKEIISIFPIPRQTKSVEANLRQQIDYLRNALTAERNTDIWNDLRSRIGLENNAAVAITVPMLTDRTDLISCNEIEFIAWTAANLNNTKLLIFSENVVRKEHHTLSKDAEIYALETWMNLINLMTNNDYRKKRSRVWVISDDTRKECILTFRKILAMHNKEKAVLFMSMLESIKASFKYDMVAGVYSAIGNYLYNSILFNTFGAWCHSTESTALDDIMNNAKNMIKECVILSDKILRENNGFGFTSTR